VAVEVVRGFERIALGEIVDVFTVWVMSL